MLAGSALLAVAVFSSSASEAAPAPAGTLITNAASATYTDPATPATTLTANSNTVTITVAEIAGITNVPLAESVAGGGPVLPGSTVNFDFKITNTGNGSNGFSIPNTATVGGTTGATLSGSLLISYDGGATFVPLATAAGAYAGGRLATTPIVPGGSVIVRVAAAVPLSAVGTSQTITAQLGNTGPNDNSAATQNQAYAAGHAGNIFTTNTAAEPAPGPPLNGQREAAALATINLGSRPQAFAQLLKAGAVATFNLNPQLDTIVYSLTLNVLATYPSASSGYTPAPLTAAALTSLNGVPASRVLISDVIPVNTTFTGAATPPGGWTLVYSTDVTNIATSAAFTTAAPANLATVKRIGWINAGPIALGTSTTGFGYTVTATGVPANATGTVLNIGQVFGNSQGDPTNTPVYDQSGDQLPSNYTAGNGTPGSSLPGISQPTNGVPPSGGPNDPGNNTGPAGGANNVVTVSPQAGLLNGPASVAGATGPDGTNNTDLTQQSVALPAGLDPAAGIPTPLTASFTNTVMNPGNTALTQVTLVPQTPATPGALPDGTTARIAIPGQPGFAISTYTAASGWTLTGGAAIVIPSIAAGASQNYTVDVTLPAGTLQSTNGGAAANGFPVPILASSTTAFGTLTNLTTDTVFTGVLRLVKLGQVFNADGSPCDAAPTLTPSPSCVIPGNFIVYGIAYTNIAPQVAGTGNALLSVDNIVITEDGQAAPNNFATVVRGVVRTSNVKGSASDTTTGNTITFFNALGSNVGDITGAGTPTADVTKYVDTFAASLPPGATGTFTFRRKIN